MELRLNIEGATPEELARGVAAAEAVFARAGITALQGAEGLFALEGWDIKGFPEDDQPTENEDQAASAWEEADEAATIACCAGWPQDKVPHHQVMELIDVPRTRLRAEALSDTWPARKQLYPDVVKRLEVTAGPDRQIDFDIAFVLGWVPERPTQDRVEPLSEDATVSPSSPATSPRLKKWLARRSRAGRSRLTGIPMMPTFLILQPAKMMKNCAWRHGAISTAACLWRSHLQMLQLH
ncbi:hypothetical protein [Mesorhizobium sp. M7A.F.Ca.US.010.02.1.1]|uniref:hypothetical protein n=1 Tax=Mesorhizobium sp. M7A.F.Ca.US.010.02.1.1 TaxID=2496743 RepID=UPI001FE009FB|nr:hypothetical protein [Mesorhizobium sp. M7A.F.Ca.US.010.02.1.1]